jgi:cytochrome c oxidase cbb3-type subunit 2
MPSYPWLFDTEIDAHTTGKKMASLRMVGVPYTDDDIAGASAAVAGKKESDAVVAYLQQLGTLLQSRR